MKMLVTTGKHSYLIDKEELNLVELGSVIFVPEEEKMYLLLEPNVLTEIETDILSIEYSLVLFSGLQAF